MNSDKACRIVERIAHESMWGTIIYPRSAAVRLVNVNTREVKTRQSCCHQVRSARQALRRRKDNAIHIDGSRDVLQAVIAGGPKFAVLYVRGVPFVIERSLRAYYIAALSPVSFLYTVLHMLQTLSFTSVSQARWCHVVPSQARWPFDRIESKSGARRPSLQVVIAAAGIPELNMSAQASRQRPLHVQRSGLA